MIRNSSARQVSELVSDLGSDDDVRREAAIARLAVIGARAVDRILELVDAESPPRLRVAALRTLEAIGDERALHQTLNCLTDDDPTVAAAAVGATRRLLDSRRGTAALDALMTLALDTGRDAAVRLAALEALTELPAQTMAPVWARLRQDPSLAVRRYVRAEPGSASTDPVADLERALATPASSGDAEGFRLMVAASATSAPLTTLHRAIEFIRAREAAERQPRRRARWTAARAAVHQALATRGSRVAVYDLRETLAAASSPLSLEWLSAMSAVGDVSCLEPLAGAYARAGAEAGGLWRDRLAATFREIVRRERITKRHTAIKRVRSRWPDAARALIGHE